MEEEKLRSLVQGYIDGTASKAALEELSAFISKDENAEMISEVLEKVLAGTGGAGVYDRKRFDPLLKSIVSSDKVSGRAKSKIFKLYPLTRWIAAAAVISLIITGAYFYFNKGTRRQVQGDMTKTKVLKNNIPPGGNKAILTLSNGTRIILDSAANGNLAQQGNTKIIKLDSGQLAYQPVTLSEAKGLVGYNTISTPKGGQYQVVLADGSKIWLNAASSLRYPTAFNGKERNVELTGEGYFEVSHDATKPFKVAVNGMEVQVLGTHFNINAYNDESAIKTTLLEGSVKVSLPSPLGEGPGVRSEGVRLKPGQQAQVNKSGQIKVSEADLDEAVAWKNGMFNFKGADIETIMRQVARWYDVEVAFEGKIPSKHYNGEASRNLDASQMLKVLEESGVKFSIEGKKITVKD